MLTQNTEQKKQKDQGPIEILLYYIIFLQKVLLRLLHMSYSNLGPLWKWLKLSLGPSLLKMNIINMGQSQNQQQ